MTRWYGEDLAYIHDVGFRDYALGAAPGILEVLDGSAAREGLVVDLGCGSGLLARELTGAGYRVLGIDISEAMIELARPRAPEAGFRVGSLFEAELPECVAVTAVGEVFNYLFDSDDGRELASLFCHVHDALVPGGVFVFDVAEPERVRPDEVPTRNFTEGEGWVVLVEKEEDAQRGVLTRWITTFRRVGELYRRDDEAHRLRLYAEAEVTAGLRAAGFEVRTMSAYGKHALPEGHKVFVARKPA